MKILSLECSATPCSAAIIEDGKILASDFVNIGLTHSQILMPMAEKVAATANVSLKDIEGFFGYMEEKTGTLWENDGDYASCNHGFSSHVVCWLNGIFGSL